MTHDPTRAAVDAQCGRCGHSVQLHGRRGYGACRYGHSSSLALAVAAVRHAVVNGYSEAERSALIGKAFNERCHPCDCKRFRPGVTMRLDNDCLRCSVATLLGRSYGSVPHFVELAGPDCWSELLAWATVRGLDLEGHEDDPGVRCIAKGTSPRGRSHAVVWDGGLLFDPHPSRAGFGGSPVWFVTLTERGDPHA